MRKDSDYLQFRPYHAFTAHAAPPAKISGVRWWLLIVGTLMLLIAAAVWVSLR